VKRRLQLLSVNPRLKPPVFATNRNHALAYRVWAMDMYDRYVCVGAFRYLLECLDFIGYCHGRETTVWFQSPTGVEEKKAPVRAEPANAD
jgi:hypothetical protein